MSFVKATACAVGSVLFLCMIAGLAAGARIATSDEELVRASKMVVDARVRSLTAHWDETGSIIFTTVELEISRSLLARGAPTEDVIRIEVPGGEVGDVGMLFTDVPTFKQGERVVVFVQPWTQGRFVVAGAEDGRLAVDEAGMIPARGMSVDRFASHVKALSE